MSTVQKQAKAQALFDEGNVQQVNNDTFVCHGSNGNQYEIKVNKDPNYNYKYYCKCPAWKFDSTRECKHVLAVELLKKSKPHLTNAQTQKYQQAMNKPKSQYKVRKAKEKCEDEIENKGKDGKNKPLRFDKDGKLIIQYSQKVETETESEEDYDE